MARVLLPGSNLLLEHDLIFCSQRSSEGVHHEIIFYSLPVRNNIQVLCSFCFTPEEAQRVKRGAILFLIEEKGQRINKLSHNLIC